MPKLSSERLLRDCRDIWTRDITADVRDALQTYGVQNLRNAITAASFLATTCGLIAIQGLLAIILDTSRLERVKEFSVRSPRLVCKPVFAAACMVDAFNVFSLHTYLHSHARHVWFTITRRASLAL